MKLKKHDRTNFQTLAKAFDAGQVCLLDVRRRADGKAVAVICATQEALDGQVLFIPFAVMVEGNPFELFEPPNPDGGYFVEADT